MSDDGKTAAAKSILDAAAGKEGKNGKIFLLTSLYILFFCVQNSSIRCIFVGNIIVDHSDVVGASPVGTAPTTSSFST